MSHKLVSLYIGEGEYYTRTDADNVIAEKDKEIQRLENLCESYRIDCDNLAITTDRMRTAGRTLREKMTHHKYKRCLDKAELCRLEQERIELIECQDITDYDFNKLVKGFYKKWREHWLKIAEKFKPNNSTAQ